MIVKILVPFGDRDNFAKKYSTGEVCEIEDKRAKALIERGLVAPEGDLDDADFGLVKAHVEKKSEELETLKVKLEGKESDLDKRAKAIGEREIELKKEADELDGRVIELGKTAIELNQLKADLDKREIELDKTAESTKVEGANPLAEYERDILIEKLNLIGIVTPKNIGEAKLSEKIAALSEDESAKLKAELEKE